MTTTFLRHTALISCFHWILCSASIRHKRKQGLVSPDFTIRLRGRLLPVLIVLSIPFSGKSQGVNIGIPPIWNFSRKVYAAGTQNWDSAQDAWGRMYFANNDGLVRFDGSVWQTFPIGNHTIVRSVAIDEDHRIYVGGQSEMGFFFPGKNGNLTYQSLTALLPPEKRTFEDVWDICFLEHQVFFRTNKNVYVYHQDTLRVITPGFEIIAMFSIGGDLFIQSSGFELHKWNATRFVFNRRINQMESAITGALPWQGDTTLLTTLKNGIFYFTPGMDGVWKTAADQQLREKRIYASSLLSQGNLLLGTSLDGAMVIDAHRRVYRHLNKKHGLQNNNVLSTFCDREGNAWLGLDNGIDCIVLDSKFTNIYPDGELQATGYRAVVADGNVYLGVSNGAYVAPWKKYYDPESGSPFSRVTESDGQVWGFYTTPDGLLMGHHEGAFAISGNRSKRISASQGYWTFVSPDENHLIAGTYTGLVVYKKTGTGWKEDQKINGINESCRIMIQDDQKRIWISHPYRGLYLVKWNAAAPYDPEITFYDSKNGLPSHLNNYVFNISGKAVFGTEHGVYRFDEKENLFVPDTDYNQMIGNGHRVKYMQEDQKGNIWYVTDQEVGLLQVEEFGLKKEVDKVIFPEIFGKLVGGFESIYPVDEHNIVFGSEEGFIHYDGSPGNNNPMPVQLVFTSITASLQKDTLLYGGHFVDLDKGENLLTNSLNNISFAYSATTYTMPNLVEYRTQLEGLQANWSPWTNDTKRYFTNLAAGSYTFKVQARVREKEESEILTYRIRIRPPWYKTNMAFGVYGCAIFGCFLGVVMRQRRKFESEKVLLTESHKEIEAQHIREVEQSKAALHEIQNEKLEVEIKYKNQELALTTMHLVQKAEILLSVQEGLHHLQDKTTQPASKKEIQHLLNLLNFDVKLDEDWEHFAHHFDQVHVDFLKNLRERFPQLSSNDLKLCAYLRMNLTTKEIAPLMNISIRGVEGSRYRLRRKLDLPNDANLTEFILGIATEQ